MFPKKIFALLFLLFVVQISADDEFVETMKRFLLNKKKTTASTTKSTAGAIAALITTSPASKRVETVKPSVTPKKPSISTKDACGVINPCKNGGTCKTLSSGSYYCFCTQDYYGKTCDNKFISTGTANRDRATVDHCAKNPCKNNGECVGLRTTFYCRCKTPFYGTSCEKRI